MEPEFSKVSTQHVGRETSTSMPPPPPMSATPVILTTVPPPVPSEVVLPIPASVKHWRVQVLETRSVLPVGAVPEEIIIPPPKEKSILEAYMLGLPLGILGLHHAYLGRPGFCALYIFTFGLLGVGWVIDLLRMPCLVSRVNKENREKYDEFIKLQQDVRQQRNQHQRLAFVSRSQKSLDDAYILWFPFGLLGFHHFYLRNYGLGVFYLFTFGMLGLAWLVDLFRMPSLVKQSNSRAPEYSTLEKNLCVAQCLAMSPAGILGGHHYYLGRHTWGVLYTLTLGMLGTGWLVDCFRTFILVKRADAVLQGREQVGKKYIDDAYILCFPWGFTGLHHFYLRRYGWGFLYLFTLGLMGVGWIIDWFRIPCLVKDANKDIRIRSMVIATPSSSLVRHTTSTGGNTVPPVGNVNYGYQSSAPMGNNIASYPAPAPGFQGYMYQAGYPNPNPCYSAPAGEMPPPPQYTPTQNMASGVIGGCPPPPYKASGEDITDGKN